MCPQVHPCGYFFMQKKALPRERPLIVLFRTFLRGIRIDRTREASLRVIHIGTEMARYAALETK